MVSAEHVPGADGPLAVEQFPAGHSNLTYSVRLGSQEIVLRRPSVRQPGETAHDMGREFRVLSKLHAVYPPAPRALGLLRRRVRCLARRFM